MPQTTFCPRHWRHLAILLLTFTSLSNHTSAQDKTTAWRADPAAVEAFQKRRPEFNVDESKVPEHTLPDVLASLDGSGRITDSSTWLKTHRPRLLQMFRETVYGVRPTTPYEISYRQTGQETDLFGIDASARQIEMTIKTERGEHSFEFVLFLPKSDQPVPVIVQINNRYFVPMQQAIEKFDPFWPVEKILRAGFATAAFHTSDVDPDAKNQYDNGIRALLDDPNSDPELRWKSLSAWGWAASRVLDYAIEQPQIDPNRSAVVGHSRGGKTALWAAAEDERFTIGYSNDSGCGGAALSRRAFGETVERINQSFPYWFCDRFKEFNGRENELPIDQHQLIALLAPRAVYVASADQDLWADPRGEYLSLLAAGPAFELFDQAHIESVSMPPLDQPRHVGQTGYHIRSGKHNLTEQDWGYFLEFAKTVFDKQ